MDRNLWKYIAGLLLFGSNGVVAHYIALPSRNIVLLRSLLGAALLLVLFFLTGNRFTVREHKKDALFVVLSGVAMAADWLLLFEAYARIGVSLGMIINYVGPVFVVLGSALLFRERINGKTLFCLAASLTGAVLISWQGMGGGLDRIGLLVAILSAFAIAAMVLLNKMSEHITGMENATIQLLTTAIVVAIYVLFRDGGLPLGVPEGSLLPMLWLGLINTGLGCYLYFSPLSSLKAQTVAICGYLEPLSAVLFSMLILHERMLPLQVLGGVLILGGTILLNVDRPKKL